MKRRAFLSLVGGVLCAPLVPKTNPLPQKQEWITCRFLMVMDKTGRVSFFKYRVGS